MLKVRSTTKRPKVSIMRTSTKRASPAEHDGGEEALPENEVDPIDGVEISCAISSGLNSNSETQILSAPSYIARSVQRNE
jgi:hypothetical protein